MRALRVALAFLTRLPVSASDVQPSELARSLAFFPAVGLLLGALLAAAQLALGQRLPAELSALSLVALWALLTGALHLDGLADLFDGLGGGRGDPARALAIMRDSRIGAHGAVALVLVLSAKTTATAELVRHACAWPLLAAPIAARWAVVPLIAGVRYAREEGLGRAMTEHARTSDVVWASLLALACLAALGLRALYPTLAALACAGALAGSMRWRLGGLTGDVYGAAIELAELGFLVASVCVL
jgi:adenosylcobinamide-GDP ribazoletransferase